MRHSKQRDLIYAAVCRLDHPTAEEVYAALKTDFPQLSLGTVYRNLRLLEEQNILLSIPRKTGGTCYDGNPREHGHIQCIRCGKIEDVPRFSFQELDRCLKEQRMFEPVRHDVMIYGFCKDCRKKQTDD